MTSSQTNLSLSAATILVTGGAGFIGSNFIRSVLGRADFTGRIVNYDKLTYAGNLLNLSDLEQRFGGERYFFEHGDIRDFDKVKATFTRYGVAVVVHFAAESHVDRSIFGPKDFVETNINGTFTLLEAARESWSGRKDVRFHHISTDEVYGSLGETGTSPKRLRTIPEVPIPLQRRPRTTWCGPIFIPTVFLSHCPTARTTTGPITSRRN